MLLDLLALFGVFFKIGLFTVGGGMAMLPLVQQELIARGWMTVAQSVDMVAISQMTPGPFAINAATFVGMQRYGIPGATAATLGVALPSVVLCLLVARVLKKFQQNPLLRSALSGIHPAVLALIISSLISIASDSLFPSGFPAPFDWPVLLIALVVFVLLQTKKVGPFVLILAAGIGGAVFLHL
ncbi:MAG: chromate transporter [Oscillospiraceae bacterium]